MVNFSQYPSEVLAEKLIAHADHLNGNAALTRGDLKTSDKEAVVGIAEILKDRFSQKECSIYEGPFLKQVLPALLPLDDKYMSNAEKVADALKQISYSKMSQPSGKRGLPPPHP